MEMANQILPATIDLAMGDRLEKIVMSVAERQEENFKKLDLSGLESWTPELVKQACSLVAKYHDLFLLQKHEIGYTKAVEHNIILKDPEWVPFKECFRRIWHPQVDEVREHLKLLLTFGFVLLTVVLPFCCSRPDTGHL